MTAYDFIEHLSSLINKTRENASNTRLELIRIEIEEYLRRYGRDGGTK